MQINDIRESRINMLGPWLTREFGEKTVKLSLDGDFTCPNRDGTCGTGGCSFCSERGSGDNASMYNGITQKAISDQIALLSDKWPTAKSFIAYFQNYTGTYAPTEKLSELYYSALAQPGVRGLAIATRPDCLPEETLDLLEEINKKHFLWVELGLQTTNDKSAEAFGRGYKTEVYHKAVEELNKRNIRIVTHLLLGLPGETREDMMRSLMDVIRTPHNHPVELADTNTRDTISQHSHIWGLKFHLLNIVRGTRLAEEMPDYMPFGSPEEYASLVCDLLELTPPEVVIHRLSADSPKDLLIAPKWAYRKRLVINTINLEMVNRNAFQGDKTK
ncbi:MAG: TIGR01212 family radical SAM protein [Firmicutes bacterium]|nr:TIGR01212 family radical SAM protein [Bacillota bacterium]